jgi:pre-rRNA-processing protein TSR2
VALSLHLWPALTLAVQNNWGGSSSDDKRDWFAGAIVELFPPFPDQSSQAAAVKPENAPEEPDIEDIETVLLQVMLDEFEVNVDDESGFEVAERILIVRDQCAKGNFVIVDELRNKWQARKGGKVDTLFKKAEDADQDTDWESDDDEEDDDDEDDDIDMEDAPALVSVPKEKPPPEVDEDGFTKVTRKKK